MRNRKLLKLFISIVLLAGAGAVLGNRLGIFNKAQPKDLFREYYPKNNQNGFTYERGSTRTINDNSVKVIIYNLVGEGNKIIISQQADPEKKIYDKFVEQNEAAGRIGGIVKLAPIDSTIGQGVITSAFSKDDGTLVALNASGTLLFANADKPLTEDVWQSVFDSLQSNCIVTAGDWCLVPWAIIK